MSRLDPERPGPWIGLALAAKLVLFVIFLRFFTPDAPGSVPGFRGLMTNDSFSYVEPIEQYLSSGDASRVFLGFRMFGYGLPFLLLRSFLSQPQALNALIVFQLLLSAVSVYLLARIALIVSGSTTAFLLTFVGYFLLPIVSFYDVVALTESFTASALVISLFLLLAARRGLPLLFAGAFLAWAVFLRPVALPLLALYAAYVTFVTWRQGTRTVLQSVVTLLSPFLLAEGVWAAGRVASDAKEHLFLQASFHPIFGDPSRHSMAMIRFLQALGEEWNHTPRFYAGAASLSGPCRIQTSRFDCATLADVERTARRAQADVLSFNRETPDEEVQRLNRELNQALPVYTASIRAEHPFHYFVVAPVRYLVRLASATPTFRMFGGYDTMTPRLRPYRLMVDALWWVLECLFAVVALWRWRVAVRQPGIGLLLGVILYFFLVHTLVFRTDDFRYVVPVLPLVVAFTASALLGRRPGADAAEPSA